MAEKKPDDDEDDDDDLEAAPAHDEEADADDDAPDFDDDEDEESGGGKGKLIAIIAVAVVLLIAAAGGSYFFLFHGDGEEETAAAPAAEKADSDDGTSMTISRNRRVMSSEEMVKQGLTDTPAASGGLTPPAPATGAAAPSESTAMATAPSEAGPAAPQLQAPAAIAAPQAPAKGAKGKGVAAPGPTTPETQGLVTPAVTAAAFRDIPVLPAGKPLSAPDPSYGETVDAGIIPRARGSTGVWKAYARPFDGPADKPRVAIIITGLGLSRASTLAAISQTPGGITLAFDPYTRNLDEWVGLGRSNGHEALMQLPMEPTDFPVSDPGPLAMLTDLEPAQNVTRLHQILASAIGYTGVIQVMGSKFAASEAAMRPTLEELKKRGVLFVSMPASNDDRGLDLAQQVGVPATRVDLKLDSDLTAASIDDRISELERMAREKGRAVAVAEAYPLTLARLSLWGQSLSLKEITLAPASAMAQVGAPAPPAAAKGGAPKH